MTFVSSGWLPPGVDARSHVDTVLQVSSSHPGAGGSADDLPEQLRIRREKYDRLMADPELAPDTSTGQTVSVTGRVIFIRNTGKLCFATLREDGVELQAMLSHDRVGAESLAAWKSDVDLGDLVQVTGEVISSRRGELSVLAESWRMTAKALRPLPVAHRPMSEESRVRQRYVDLIVRPEARRMVLMRAQVLTSLRTTLQSRGYIEVETPVLQSVHGGAAARPFHTHLNAFDQPMSLRIATELYLKRALIGGIDRVFEIGKTFRNEGIDSTHSAEFTMLEAYEAYGDYHSMAELTRALILDAAAAVGVETPTASDGTDIDLAAEWRWASVYELVTAAVGESVTPDDDVEKLRALAESMNVACGPDSDAGAIVLEMYEKLVEHTLIQPTFVCDYPRSVRPLARTHRADPRLAEAWDLVIGGVEIAPGYSELADPVEQRRLLTEQSLVAAAGDPEAMQLDEEFLQAQEYGMPPAGGMGLGVDRLLGLFAGRGIRETILFPLLKPLS
jgi:lysyl-tRNA synthetase class 2